MKALVTLATATALLSITACAPVQEPVTTIITASPEATEQQISDATPSAPSVTKGIADSSATAEQLAYLIEEEKLAHDIYTAMYELWGARAFGNILNSESNHQDQVLTVMNSLGVADVRETELGVFTDSELQKLYDDLLAKGTKSLTDAYEVGVAIEELDIADLTEMLSTATDPAVIAMMENLRRGSENHLRAFNSKL